MATPLVGIQSFDLTPLAAWLARSNRGLRAVFMLYLVGLPVMAVVFGIAWILDPIPVPKGAFFETALALGFGIGIFVLAHVRSPPDRILVTQDAVEFQGPSGLMLSWGTGRPLSAFRFWDRTASARSQAMRPYLHELRWGLAQWVVPLTPEAFRALVDWASEHKIELREREITTQTGEHVRELRHS